MNDEIFENDIFNSSITFDPKSKIQPEKFNGNHLLEFENGVGFGYEYFQENGFQYPIKFKNKDGLGIRVPGNKFTIDDIRRLVGSHRQIDIFDCYTLQSYEIPMKQFCQYFKNPQKYGKLLNLTSLEFSNTKLDDYVQPPPFVSELDWIELAWPIELRDVSFDDHQSVTDFNYPKVQKYVLASVKDCYTDFHVDFCGTSVWYHINSGSKIFWVAPPTEENIKTYERWVKMPNHDDTFLGDILTDSKCQVVRISAGETLLLPSGWIHSVYTESDSIVFGGNFLNSFSIKNQIRIRDLEDKLHTNKKYRFPLYDKLCDFVLQKYCYMLALGTPYADSPLLNIQFKKQQSPPDPNNYYFTPQEHAGLYLLIDHIEKYKHQTYDIVNGDLVKLTKKLLNSYDTQRFNNKCSSRPFLHNFITQKFSRGLPIINRKSKVNPYSIKHKTIRRSRCKKCEPCTREECRYCIYCLDMKKYGGLGKQKQSCLSRRCIAPQLPKGVECFICKQKGNDLGLKTSEDELDPNMIYECSECYLISHPACFLNKYRDYIDNKIPKVNEDLPSSWVCYFYVNNIDVKVKIGENSEVTGKTIFLDDTHYINISGMNFPSSKIKMLQKIDAVSKVCSNELLITPLVDFMPPLNGAGCIEVKKAKIEKSTPN